MTLVYCSNPTEFRVHAEAFLTRHEAENNLSLGLLNNMDDGNYPERYLSFHQASDGTIDGTAVLTPPYNVVLSYPCSQAALDAIADDLLVRYPEMHGVNGDKTSSAYFAKVWTARTGKSAPLELGMHIYKLEKVQFPVGIAGEMRRATEDNRDLLVNWALAFQQEALNESDEERAQRMVNNYITSSERFMAVWWHQGKPVSMAGASGRTPNGIRIGVVYTPPEYRQRGYASANVAALSQKMLDEGRTFCFLFTDSSNPTSNHVYQQIGYEWVSDVDTYKFEG
jgi:predicted GNAT family acetyltransferase